MNWVKVERGLPTDGEKVLVWMKDVDTPMAVLTYHKAEKWDTWHDDLFVFDGRAITTGSWYTSAISHWASLPKPPADRIKYKLVEATEDCHLCHGTGIWHWTEKTFWGKDKDCSRECDDCHGTRKRHFRKLEAER